MEGIKLTKIEKQGNTITYRYEVTAGLTKYFSERAFQIDYPESIESVPDGIAAIPFVCNVLPIIWLTNSKLVVPELDEAFYRCIPEVKKGYETMYPESEFLGEIEVERIMPCDKPAVPGKCAMFYSGGVDSMDTLFRHLEEKPALISIWGSDIKYDNVDGWVVLHKAIKEVADRYHLPDVVIRSTFREFDKEGELGKEFSPRLRDSWWHGVKHGIGLLGHVAPYAYLYGLEKTYIASSNCPADGPVRCASNPLIDNYVKFVGCEVTHDGFEYSRQDKICNIVKYAEKRKQYLPIHVCWETQTGENCCRCEKCYRTIAAILAENGNPEQLAFTGFQKYLPEMKKVVVRSINDNLTKQWIELQKGLRQNKNAIKVSPYWKDICWIEKADFEHPETIQMPVPFGTRVRQWLSQFRFYQHLHDLKEKAR